MNVKLYYQKRVGLFCKIGLAISFLLAVASYIGWIGFYDLSLFLMGSFLLFNYLSFESENSEMEIDLKRKTAESGVSLFCSIALGILLMALLVDFKGTYDTVGGVRVILLSFLIYLNLDYNMRYYFKWKGLRRF